MNIKIQKFNWSVIWPGKMCWQNLVFQYGEPISEQQRDFSTGKDWNIIFIKQNHT